MKKHLALISSALLATTFAFTSLSVSADVGDSMKLMSKNYRLVVKDNDAASLKKDLTAFRAAAVEAKAGKIDKAAQQPQFEAGMDMLLQQTDIALKFADEGKVKEAKAEAAKLKLLMKEYHGKLGV